MHGAESDSSGKPVLISMRASAFCRSISNSIKYVPVLWPVRFKYINFTTSWKMLAIASGANRSREMRKICATPAT